MNKQQLASRIWEAANKMRSKIEASEYKDYILGFIFYKFLSEKEVAYLKKEGATEKEIKELTEDDPEQVKMLQNNIGYFIAYKNLFQTWLDMGYSFNISNVRDALSAFNRLISPSHITVFNKIFLTLETGLSKLGNDASSQTKAVRDLINLINIIPMDNKQGYDVLGFIYEYLISNFAASAGKKAGEFYTPHEVSVLMSEIIATYLNTSEEIKIYDPTSGSGSLLINIGQSVAKHIKDKNKIRYYAQELKENTYNLTRMNLVMRGILPANIVARCGDTLEDDWPYFEDNDKENTYEPLTNIDAVVSNPPYSQHWDPTNKENDPRFAHYGVAPKSKADYAFLLHDLFHLKVGGIMTIILPHGVLFRGGDEGEIRKNLVEKNHIDAIIGLPSNIFFGTGIPTIIMILKKGRSDDDILIIDASKEFVKDGKNNKLRSRDIKKITDTYSYRLEIKGYSRKVSRDEVRGNDYNLNIPRYVDSSEKSETIDIYASIFGGVPKAEINETCEEFEVFPTLRDELFTQSNTPYVSLKTNNSKTVIENNKDVIVFNENFSNSFESFGDYLNNLLIMNMDDLTDDLAIPHTEVIISDEIFKRLEKLPLIDKYEAYQILDDNWNVIQADLEMIETEGKKAITQVDPNMVLKKKDNKEVEVQDGYIGHILPFDIVQRMYLKDELNEIKAKEDENTSIQSQLDEILENIQEEDRGDFINEDETAFIPKEVAKIVKSYAKSKDKPEEGSIEETLIKVNELLKRQKEISKEIKNLKSALHIKTKEMIENFSIEETHPILYEKWISPILSSLSKLTTSAIDRLESKIDNLSKKYDVRMIDIENEIEETEKSLSTMIDELIGNEYDTLALKEIQKLLKGGKND